LPERFRPKGDGDMQAAKRDCNAPSTRYFNIWICGRQTDLSVMGVRVSVANFGLGQSIGIDETNIFFSSKKILGATDLDSLWALEWAWHILVANLRCVQGYGM